jgi:hypothetical protein
MRFRTTILQAKKTATGIEVPPDVLDRLGAGKRPPVLVTVGGHTYRSTVASMGGRYMIGLSAENRAAAGVGGGDEVDVELALDTQPREVDVPEDLAVELERDPVARTFFDSLSYSGKRAFTYWIDDAKKAETRATRVATSVRMLHDGERR